MEKKRRKPEKTTETGFTQRISKEYYNLTAAEKKAADYVVAHRAEAQNLSITELAAASDVAEATISRFVRRLKYKGYNRRSRAGTQTGRTYLRRNKRNKCRLLFSGRCRGVRAILQQA